MKIEQKDPNNLIEYAFNNRVHSDEQIDLIANSINEFGFNQPIVVDEDNIILVGHGRLRAAKKLNLKQVPVLQLSGLDEVKKRAYRILDNKIQTDSEWDLEGLNIELPWLENEGFDLDAWGLGKIFDDLPKVLDSVDIGPEERESNYTRSFNLTEEQAESVDNAIDKARNLIPEELEGNKNANALTFLCEKFLAKNG